MKERGRRMIEDEAERINKVILKREKALKKGNEVEVESIEKALKKEGFEIRDTDDITFVSKKKKANI
jgi:cysteinyl-tRNA synthetase